MKVETAWVKPPAQIRGLDHLAVQAPCINIYGRLLPGITNVTDRARYYSFYPWLIWAFDQKGFTRFDNEFVERFRRADCLFSLIAERHASISADEYENHAAAMVGSDTLASVARELDEGDTIILSDYSATEGAKARYFKNKLGGLGQYYLGVLRELSVLDGDSSHGIRYTRQIGQALGESLSVGFDADLFLAVVEANSVTTAQLDTLVDLCPCKLSDNSTEQAILSELFFVRGDFYDAEALPRRRTLQSILQLSELLAGEAQSLTESIYRSCVYAGALPSGEVWPIPESLTGNREKWATYARNELLSVAVQGLFFALLDAYEEAGLRFDSSREVVAWYCNTSEVHEAIDQFGEQKTFSSMVRDTDNWLPPLTDWINPKHECALADSITRLSNTNRSSANRRDIVSAALQVLLALLARTEKPAEPYGELIFDEKYFSFYPINLQALEYNKVHTWSSMSPDVWLNWLLQNWGIDVHLRVALRKLRGQSRSTFRIRPSDRGLEVIAVQSVVHTRPRFNQALRVLKDIGALKKESSGLWTNSSLGRAMLELSDAP